MKPTDDRIAAPVVVVEVLSRTTADRDRSAKWVGYQDIPSLQHYVPVAQDRRRVDLFTRTGETWNLVVVRPPRARVALSAIAIELTLDEIHETAAPEESLGALSTARLSRSPPGSARGRPVVPARPCDQDSYRMLEELTEAASA